MDVLVCARYAHLWAKRTGYRSSAELMPSSRPATWLQCSQGLHVGRRYLIFARILSSAIHMRADPLKSELRLQNPSALGCVRTGRRGQPLRTSMATGERAAGCAGRG